MINVKDFIIFFDYQGPEIDDITRNLTTLYGTIAGTVPLDRDFGISEEFVSYPIPVAENMLVLELTEKTALYEPRVEVSEVTFDYNSDGILTPRIIITKSENN